MVDTGQRMLTSDEFAPLTGATFEVKIAEDQAVAMRLIDVSELGSNPLHRSFSLQFQGSGNRQLPQSIYNFRHPQLGEQAIFIVPISVNTEGFVYEAVFN